MTYEMHNAHVIKWIRWQHFMAERQHRYLAMLVWAAAYAWEASVAEGA